MKEIEDWQGIAILDIRPGSFIPPVRSNRSIKVRIFYILHELVELNSKHLSLYLNIR